MKKYKLIKEYPGSPPKDSIGWIESVSLHIKEPCGKTYFQCDSSNKVLNTFEYSQWVEVVEKDYEILSFKGQVSKSIYELNKEGKYKCKTLYRPLHLSFCLHHNYNIHSVKRLSDGEVFTVGDKICNTTSEKESRQGYITINSFKIVDNYLYIEHDTGFRNSKYGWDELSHYKSKPLFTTEDGVDIFEGDDVWGVTVDTFKVFSGTTKYNNNFHTEVWKHGKFSTKEAAEEYILMNAPRLSINDIQKEIFNLVCDEYYNKIIKALKELVKSKS